jgi:chromosome segregation ATPase
LQSKYEGLNKEEQEIKIQYRSLSQDHSRLTQQHQEQLHNFELTKQSYTELQIKLKSYEEKIASLESALSKSDNKIQIIRDDYNFVMQEKANLEGQVKQLQKFLPVA